MSMFIVCFPHSSKANEDAYGSYCKLPQLNSESSNDAATAGGGDNASTNASNTNTDDDPARRTSSARSTDTGKKQFRAPKPPKLAPPKAIETAQLRDCDMGELIGSGAYGKVRVSVSAVFGVG